MPDKYDNSGYRGMGKDILRSLNRSGTGQSVQESQMDTAQSISDQMRGQGLFAKPRQGIKMDPLDDTHETTHRAPGDE